MSYQKFKASHLFTGFELLPGNNVLVTDAKGIVQDIIDESNAGEDVQSYSGILSPGFVNTHCHLELSHLKGTIAENTGLIDFLIAVPKLRQFEPEAVQEAISRAETEMYTTGTVAVGDICNTADTIPVKQQSRLRWHNFIETIGFSNEKAPERFACSQAVWQQFESIFPGCNTLVPHAPYSVSEVLFGLLNDASAGKISTMHNQESAAENELYQTKTGDFLRLYQDFGIDTGFFNPSGKSSVQTWLPWLSKPKHLLLVHNIAITQADLALLTNQPINFLPFFPLCPNANNYIQKQQPPVELLRQNGCAITIGTDSLASNHQLNMLEEIKTLLRLNTQLSITEVLGWATINGARALQMSETLGSFEKGKQPGVILIKDIYDEKAGENGHARRII
jgi:aminodeoxyfutalosine deaminase